jgi:hypothetical protein
LEKIHKISLLIIISIWFSSPILAQEIWKELYTFETGTIDKISSDTQGNLYISDDLGIVSKYDSTGQKLLLFSPSKQSKISILNGSRNVNIFLFYKNYQEVRILDRFLTEISQFNFTKQNIGNVMICTPSLDNNIWLIDESDLSIKKYSSQFKQVLINNSLLFTLPPNKRDFHFTHFVEYNTNIYLSDLNQGIYVFDNIGNYKSLIRGTGIIHFGFYDNHLYYIEKQELKIIHLSTGKTLETRLPNSEIKRIFLHATKAFAISKHSIQVLQHNLFP